MCNDYFAFHFTPTSSNNKISLQILFYPILVSYNGIKSSVYCLKCSFSSYNFKPHSLITLEGPNRITKRSGFTLKKGREIRARNQFSSLEIYLNSTSTYFFSKTKCPNQAKKYPWKIPNKKYLGSRCLIAKILRIYEIVMPKCMYENC
jgi:hypothetical protein